MSEQTSVIEIENVGVSYKKGKSWFSNDKYWALKGLSFTLYKGETLGIIGKNGAGKSTILRLLADIIAYEQGKVVRNHGYVSLLSLALGFIPHLSARENAIMSGMLLGLSKKEIEAILPSIAEYAELNEFWNEPVVGFSNGMRARLGFSIAIHAEPDLLLIDEVLGVGDADFRIKSTAAMRQRIQSDKTIVFVSHNTTMVRQLCDRVVWIEDGKTRKEGPVADVVDEYEQELRG